METSRSRTQPRTGYSANRSFGLGAPIPRYGVPDDIGNTPPRAMGSWRTAGPVGSSKQAGSSIIAGRKLFNRTQNPSRMGPNTTRSFSDVPSNTPGRIFASSSFRPGLANGTSSKFSFSPRVPPNTIRESFPTVTPGRSFRGASADMTGRSMSKTTATNLFPMRIASPPPEFDGEELAKQIPENPNRVGSIYADEFLSHLVPSELDDLQRRQFLCILDLRRLKYAANEIFAKKDWRVNIMNFAKEYEKSRSLIMLRYGLYEFKTVPASREVLKKWKQENNVPDEDAEMADDSTAKSNGGPNSFRASTKRRAEDDLTKDTSSGSFSPQNKRRLTDREPLTESAAPTSNAGTTPFPKKTKRGSEQMDQDEENQPSKLQKSKPSATLSLFEEVANNTPAKRAASPQKPASKPLFGGSAASKPQSSLFAQASSQSGLNSPVPKGNIFGHLSEQNTPMGSDGEESEAEGEGESDDEVEEVAAPEKKSPSAAPTFGSAPPLFGGKPSTPFGGPSGTSNLFNNKEAVKSPEKRPTSPSKQNQLQDKTWNPNTPIKFGAEPASTSTPLFGASTTRPGSLFSKPAETPALGTQIKDFATETPKAGAPKLFGQTEKPSETTSNLFGNASKTPLFGKPGESKSAESVAAPSTPSLFGSKSQDASSTTPFGKPTETPSTQAKPLFGGLNTPAPSTLFGAEKDKSGGSIFGATNGEKPSVAPSLFGAPSTIEKEESTAKRKADDSATQEPPTKKYTFGGDAPAPAEKLPPKTPAAANGAVDAASVFGAPVEAKQYTFGAPAATPATTPPAAATPAPTSLFGNIAASQPEPAKTQPSLFAAPSSGFTFGSQPATTPANPPSSNLFGANPNGATNANQGSGFSFGNNSAPAPATGSFTFNAGSGDSFNNPFAPKGADASKPPSFQFGDSANPPSFQFGGGAPAAPAAPFSFGGASQPNDAPASSSFSFGGGSQPTTDASAPTNGLFGGGATNGASTMFNFGSASQQPSQSAPSGLFSGQPANAAQGIFASQLAAPPAGSSTGTSK